MATGEDSQRGGGGGSFEQGSRHVLALQDPKEHLRLPDRLSVVASIAQSPRSGKYFASDLFRNRILIFDGSGGGGERKYEGAFGNTGEGPGQLDGPTGVAVSQDGLIYVASYYNHRVDVFSEQGQFVRHFGEDRLSVPGNIAIHDRSRSLYVTDAGNNNRIAVFTLEGVHVRYMSGGGGGKGRGSGRFCEPSGVAFSPDGRHLFATDIGARRVQLFNTGGRYQREFGGGEEVGLVSPSHIAITGDGEQALVADTRGNSLVIFSLKPLLSQTRPHHQRRKEEEEGKDSDFGGGAGSTKSIVRKVEMETPQFVAIDNQGDVLVVKNNGTSIGVY